MIVDLPFWTQGGQWDAEPVRLVFDWMWLAYTVGLVAGVVCVTEIIDRIIYWWQR